MPAPIQASDIITWGYTADTASAIATFGYANSSDKLAAGTVTTGTVTSTSVQLTAAAPTGGLAPYTYQWYDSPGGTGFSANPSTLVSGATTLSNTFTGLIPNTYYGFQLNVLDSSGQSVFTKQYSVSTGNTSPTVAGESSEAQTGQVNVAATGTAVQFPSNVLTHWLTVIANSGNSAAVVIGPVGVTNVTNGTGNGTVLAKGMAVPIFVTNTNALYVNGTSGDGISFIGS